MGYDQQISMLKRKCFSCRQTKRNRWNLSNSWIGNRPTDKLGRSPPNFSLGICHEKLPKLAVTIPQQLVNKPDSHSALV